MNREHEHASTLYMVESALSKVSELQKSGEAGSVVLGTSDHFRGNDMIYGRKFLKKVGIFINDTESFDATNKNSYMEYEKLKVTNDVLERLGIDMEILQMRYSLKKASELLYEFNGRWQEWHFMLATSDPTVYYHSLESSYEESTGNSIELLTVNTTREEIEDISQEVRQSQDIFNRSIRQE